MTGGRGRWLAWAVATGLLVVVPAETASSVDATCPFTPQTVTGTVHTWDGSTDSSWGIATNWSSNHVPNDNTTGNGTPETATTYVCIPADSTVVLDDTDLSNFSENQVDVQAYWIGPRATVDIHPGVGLFAMNHVTPSVTEPASRLTVTSGYLGGEGTVDVKGAVSVVASAVTGASTLTSTPATMPESDQKAAGLLLVAPGGELFLPSLGVQMTRGYRVAVLGHLLMSGTGFLAPDYGTSVTIGAGGVFEIANDGGDYQGVSIPDTPLSALVNAGRLVKSGGAGVSVIDAAYSEVNGGHVEVLSGTMALPDGNVNAAAVAPGRTLSTGTCEDRATPNDACVLTTDPTQDSQAVSFTVPASDGNGARVLVHEDATRVFTAHADDLQATTGNPAIIDMRMKLESPGETPTGLDVVHVDDRGVEVVLPDCPAVGLPRAATNCVDRASSHAANGNVFMRVRTTQTSRYICRREDTVAPTFLAGPNVAPVVRLGKPIRLTAALNEAGTISVSGTIRTKKVKVHGLKLSASVNPAPGEPGTVVLKLRGSKKAKLRHSGAKKGVVRLTVIAIDLHGNKTRLPLVKVRLR